MRPEEYVWAGESETITDVWHTVLPDGTTWGTYESYEEAVEREPRDREFFVQTYAELVMNGANPSFVPPAPAIEVVRVRMVTKTTNSSIIVERRPMNQAAKQEQDR